MKKIDIKIKSPAGIKKRYIINLPGNIFKMTRKEARKLITKKLKEAIKNRDVH
jgi:hypothetical protein